MRAAYCDACGRPADDGEHAECLRRRELEPPRYCSRCARRMVVQVTPGGWSARCSAHGSVDGAADGAVDGTVPGAPDSEPELV